jgi:hypothetical protein
MWLDGWTIIGFEISVIRLLQRAVSNNTDPHI